MIEHAETLTLDDAGEATVSIGASGARLVDVRATPGWDIARRSPSGLFARRRPSRAVVVVLSDGIGSEAELEIGRLDDGRWEIAQRRFTPAASLGTIDVGAGTAEVHWDGRRLVVGDVEAAPGWSVERVDGPQGEDGDATLVVIWRRHADQEVELVVECGPDHVAGLGDVEVDRRERRSIG